MNKIIEYIKSNILVVVSAIMLFCGLVMFMIASTRLLSIAFLLGAVSFIVLNLFNKKAKAVTEINEKYNILNNSITPEMSNAIELQKLVNKLRSQQDEKYSIIHELDKKIASLNSSLSDIQNKYGEYEELDLLHKKKDDVEKEIEKVQDYLKLYYDYDEITLKVKEIQNELKKKYSEKIAIDEEIANKKAKIIYYDEVEQLEEVGIYKPQFDFAKATDYKVRLEKVRAEQKKMVRNDTAVYGATNWTVNGDKRKGAKMVKDTKKLLLRDFNNECDAAISKVKYSNFDTSLKRIMNSKDTISKLGNVMSIEISNMYLDKKVAELHLAYEYALKKQEEKEEQKAVREAAREAAKLEKEIAIERKKLDKEQAHYQNALEKINSQLLIDPENEELKNKKEELKNQLQVIDKEYEDMDYRLANAKAGYVYIISNIGAFGENVYKIGMTRRLEPQDRIDELGSASVPFKFDVHALIFSDDAPALEAALHRAFNDKKINMVNNRKEFFNVTLDEIKKVVEENYDKTVEWEDVASAEQFRESKAIKKAIENKQ